MKLTQIQKDSITHMLLKIQEFTPDIYINKYTNGVYGVIVNNTQIGRFEKFDCLYQSLILLYNYLIEERSKTHETK